MNHPLSSRFLRFAETECRDSSPLYEALSLRIAEDQDLLELASQADRGQPAPNLLFAAVHHLLLAGEPHPLRSYYASCIQDPEAPDDAFPHFRDFVMCHRAGILSLLKSRLVQTNEVRRSAYLFPALAFAVRRFSFRPLALVEIGTSAGLNLLWDRYAYTYGDGAVCGNAASRVLIQSSFRGAPPPALPAAMPAISHRIGLDLNVIDTTASDQAGWLRALVWPEHHERRELLDLALQQRAVATLDLRNGDGFALLEEIQEELPGDALMCVYHTHVANQIPEDARQRFLESVDWIGAKRDLIHVFNNIHPHLHLTSFRDGVKLDSPLARTEGHARWIEWLAGN